MLQLGEYRNKAVPLYVELANVMRQRIRTGEFATGDRLPTLADLQRDWGVSRVTARQAMDMLDSEGLIERGSGRGTFVRHVAVQPRERLDLTADISSLAEMVRGGTAELVTTETSSAQELPAAFPHHELMPGQPFRTMRRVHSKNGAPFSLVDLYVREDVFAREPERFRKEIAIIVLDEMRVEVARAEQVIVVSSADLYTADQLRVPINSPIANVHRVFLDVNGHAIYAANIRYRSDFVEFRIHFQ